MSLHASKIFQNIPIGKLFSSGTVSVGPFTHKGKSEIQKSIFELQSKS